MSNDTMLCGPGSSALLAALSKEGKTLTENNCVTYTTSSQPLVDLFFQIAAMRSADEESIIRLFGRAYDCNPEAALKILFWTRDIRGGQGERNTFRTILSYLSVSHPNAVLENISMIPFFGRWDDLFSLFNTTLEKDALALIDNALTGKLTESEASLCAKWMPREKSAKSVFAKKIRSHMNLSSSAYRKLLSRLTKVVETDMCAGNWDGINYSHVPSVAMLKYKNSFMRHSPERFASYIEAVASGEVKVNSSVLYPYQVIKPFMNFYAHSEVSSEIKSLANSQWEALPNYLLSNPHRILPVVDTSGSMYGDGSRVAPIDVSISLGLYIAERNNGPFKNHFLTFSGTPTLQRVEGSDLFSRVHNLKSADWGMNTDIEAVFNVILERALANEVAEEDMPNMILILSDMQFDQCAENYSLTAMESFRAKYAASGYTLPNIVFWNLAARGTNFPVKFDEAGTAMVSGFSPSILKQILSSGEITPEAILNEVVCSERYNPITFSEVK